MAKKRRQELYRIPWNSIDSGSGITIQAKPKRRNGVHNEYIKITNNVRLLYNKYRFKDTKSL